MAKQYFFQPLLPGFHSHLTIPVAFFLENIEGRYEQKTAELRSDASKIIWKVKIDGKKLTDGWKEFTLSHDLRIGDIVVFRHERDMSFHVTLLGSGCCEIQYEKIQRSKKVKKNPRGEAESSSSLDTSCFVANVSPSTLRYDSLYLPKRFVRANGIVTGSGEIVLMNQKGKSWTLKLKQKQSCGTIYIRGGWKSFCGANRLRAGDIVTFKLSQRGETLVLHLCPTESEEEEESSEANEEVVSLSSTEVESIEESSEDEKSSQECSKGKEMKSGLIWKGSSSASQNRFVTLTLTPYNVSFSRLNLPVAFTKVSGIKKAKKMCLLDKHGVKWSTNLQFEKEHKRIRLVGGWKEFCEANGVKIGESIMLELIWEADRNSVLKFCSKVMPVIK
ncbi:putative B3 domain-containing protein REM15 [Cardamine amara subsp. amara]|uniref:B3 domain-containing protein REM15 n=1 Tax=Cardamine amara subsp. amara TaxID=228776 RepID=A0ABD1A2G9_CARAN